MCKSKASAAYQYLGAGGIGISAGGATRQHQQRRRNISSGMATAAA